MFAQLQLIIVVLLPGLPISHILCTHRYFMLLRVLHRSVWHHTHQNLTFFRRHIWITVGKNGKSGGIWAFLVSNNRTWWRHFAEIFTVASHRPYWRFVVSSGYIGRVGTHKNLCSEITCGRPIVPILTAMRRVVYTATSRKVPAHNFTTWRSFFAKNGFTLWRRSIRNLVHNSWIANAILWQFTFPSRSYGNRGRIWNL